MAPLPQASANDRATRLADVILAWNVFQHFYPYFDVAHTDWPAVLPVALRSAATDPDEEAFTNTLRRLVAALKDGHGSVIKPGSAPLRVPPVRFEWIKGRAIATQVVIPDTGIAPGDELLSIDGKPVSEVLAEREALISGATPQWIRFQAMQSLVAGPMGSTAVLRIDPFQAPSGVREVKLGTLHHRAGAC